MDKKIISTNPVWEKQAKVLKKQQLHFSLLSVVESKVRIDAAKAGENPSNTLRRILDLPVKLPVRPRLGVSLTDDEIKSLSSRFDIDPKDRKSLIRRSAEVIHLYYEKEKNK
ncbi:MAG: hypothetical protein ACI9D5_002362 [Candidatus Endobugula sp.]|jgi:hypothetical protein